MAGRGATAPLATPLNPPLQNYVTLLNNSAACLILEVYVIKIS